MKNESTFFSIWDSFSTNGLKDQEMRSQVSTTFSKGPSCGLTYDEKILVRVQFHLVIFQLECLHPLFGSPFLTLNPFLGAIPKRWKKTIRLPDAKFDAESFEKRVKRNSRLTELHQAWKILGAAIRSHLISILLFANFRTLSDVSVKF